MKVHVVTEGMGYNGTEVLGVVSDEKIAAEMARRLPEGAFYTREVDALKLPFFYRVTVFDAGDIYGDLEFASETVPTLRVHDGYYLWIGRADSLEDAYAKARARVMPPEEPLWKRAGYTSEPMDGHNA